MGSTGAMAERLPMVSTVLGFMLLTAGYCVLAPGPAACLLVIYAGWSVGLVGLWSPLCFYCWTICLMNLLMCLWNLCQ